MKRTRFLLMIAAMCGVMFGLTCCSPKDPPTDNTNRLETDDFIVVDGNLDDTVWNGKKKMFIEYDGVQMNVTTTLGDKGFYVAYDVRDSRLYAIDGRDDRDNAGFEIYFDRSDAETVGSQTHMYRMSLVGQNAYYKGNAESGWTQVDSLPIIGKYSVDGELNSGYSQGATGEIFVGWDALGYDGDAEGFVAPTQIKIFPAYNRSSGSHMSDKNEIKLTPTGNVNSMRDYYLFDKDGYVQADVAGATVGDSLFGRVKTSGWDISKEAENEVKSTAAGDRFIYFTNTQKTDYVVTAKIKFVGALSGDEPKAGLMLGANGSALYSFVIDYSEEGKSSPRGQLLERNVGAYGVKEYRTLGEYVALSDMDLQSEVRLTGIKRGGYLYVFVGGGETEKFFGDTLVAIYDCKKISKNATPGFMTVDSQAIFTDYAITDDADKIAGLLDDRVTTVTVKKNIDGVITESKSEYMRNQSATYDVYTDVGYRLKSVTIDGVDVLNDPSVFHDGKLSINLVNANYLIEYVYDSVAKPVYRVSGSVIIDADKQSKDVEIKIVNTDSDRHQFVCELTEGGTFGADLPNGRYEAIISCDGISKHIEFEISNNDFEFDPIMLKTINIRVEGGAIVNEKVGDIKVLKDEPIKISYNGKPGDGKFFDCFTVDGKIIYTDTIIPNENCVIGVKLATSSSDMTWALAEETQMTDVHGTKCYKLGGASDNWILEYKIIRNMTGNSSIGVYVGGEYWAEIEVGEWGNKVHAHARSANWWTPDIALSQSAVDKLANAETVHVKVQWMRVDQYLTLFIDDEFVTEIDLSNNFGAREFGTAYRGNADSGYVGDIRFVIGQSKVTAFKNDHSNLYSSIQIAEHDEKVKIGENGVYTLPTVTVKDWNGNISSEPVTATVKDSAGNSYEVNDGKITVDYRGAIDLTITYATEKTQASCTVTVQRENGAVFEANETGAKSMLAWDSTITYDATKHHGDDSGSVKIKVNSIRGDQGYGLLNTFDWTGYDYLEFYAYTDTDGIKVGAWWYGDTDLRKDGWTYVRLELRDSNLYDGRWSIRLMGDNLASANVWLSSMNLVKQSETRTIEIADHATRVKLNASGEYTLPTATMKNNAGSVISGDIVVTVEDVAGNSYEVKDGKVIVSYRGAIDLIIFYDAERAHSSCIVTVQPENGAVVEASETGAKTIRALDSTITYDGSKAHGDDAGSIKITVNSSRGGQDYGLLNKFDWSGYDYMEFYAYTDTDGIQIGAWWYGDTDLRKDDWTYVRLDLNTSNLNGDRWIIRLMGDNIASANVWLSSMHLVKRSDLPTIEIAAHDEKVKIGNNGEYTLPSAVEKDKDGKVTGGTVVVTVKDVAGNTYEVKDGKVIVNYLGAIDLIITYKTERAQASCTVTVQRENGLVVEASDVGAKTILALDSTITYDVTKAHGDDAGSIKITVNSSRGGQDYGLLNKFDWSGYDYMEFYAYTDTDGIQIGAWWYGDTNLRKDGWTYVRLELRDSNLSDGRWIIRLMGDNLASANVWLSSMRLIHHEQNALAVPYKIQTVDWCVDNATYEYVTNVKYSGDDEQVKDNGSLKVVGTQNDAKETSFCAVGDRAVQISGYSSIYFYVYTDSDVEIKCGSWWCKEVVIQKGVWTKVEFTPIDNPGDLDGGSIFDNSQMASRFVFRLMGLTNESTVYVSSLYGVKAA